MQSSPFLPMKQVYHLSLTVNFCRKLPSAKIVLATKTQSIYIQLDSRQAHFTDRALNHPFVGIEQIDNPPLYLTRWSLFVDPYGSYNGFFGSCQLESIGHE